MKVENSRGFGKTSVRWSVESASDETATALNEAIREAVEAVEKGEADT